MQINLLNVANLDGSELFKPTIKYTTPPKIDGKIKVPGISASIFPRK